jgi:hypothetical protein
MWTVGQAERVEGQLEQPVRPQRVPGDRTDSALDGKQRLLDLGAPGASLGRIRLPGRTQPQSFAHRELTRKITAGSARADHPLHDDGLAFAQRVRDLHCGRGHRLGGVEPEWITELDRPDGHGCTRHRPTRCRRIDQAEVWQLSRHL